MSEAFDPVKHYFFEYIDPKTGKWKENTPEQAKKDYRKWQREEDPFAPKRPRKKKANKE